MSVAISSKLKSLLTSSTRMVVFTGAGVSAESGVPTFRGVDGLWKSFRVEDLATPQAFQANPARVWEWYSWRQELISKMKPNPGHYVIAQFEQSCAAFCLITQNVDGLHDRAGNRRILKLHGDLWEVRCVACGSSRTEREPVVAPFPPRCQCGGMLRPGVVWFGEMLPEGVFEQAAMETERAQLFFSIGTSAEVYPAAQLPRMARQHGAYVVEVNVQPSAAANSAHEILLGKSGEILPKLQAYFSQTPRMDGREQVTSERSDSHRTGKSAM
jgi:NAD-dependent deacetylase